MRLKLKVKMKIVFHFFPTFIVVIMNVYVGNIDCFHMYCVWERKKNENSCTHM